MKISKFIIVIGMLTAQLYEACDACKLQQPKITQNFTHGAGPQSYWDWIIVGCITLIAIYTLIYSAKYLIKPGESNNNHIKTRILEYGYENRN